MSSRLPIAPALLLAVSACWPWPPGPPCVEVHGPYICDSRLADTRSKLDDLAAHLTLDRGDDLAVGSPDLGQAGHRIAGRASLSITATPVTRRAPSMAGTVTALDGSLPASTLPVEKTSAVALAVDASLGLWGGFRDGEARFLGVDVLAGMTRMPGYGGGEVSGATSASHMLSAGVRLGLLSGVPGLPDLSLTLRQRRLPAASFASGSLATSEGGGVSYVVDRSRPTVTNTRIDAHRQLGRFGLSAGFGSDRISDRVEMVGHVQIPGERPITGRQFRFYQFHRRHFKVGLTYQVGSAHVGGDFGVLQAATGHDFYNQFGSEPGGSRRYVSLGVRLDR